METERRGNLLDLSANQNSRSTQRIFRGLVLTCCLSLLVTLTNDSAYPSPVQATSGDGITAYISPPFVQGPPANATATIEDFNSNTFCSTLGSRPVGTFSGACTSVASGNGDFKFGGANTTSDQPTVGGTASTFAAAWSSQVLTLSFATGSEVRYIGFWWSAGSAGNQVRLYSKDSGSEVLTATFTTDNLNALLNTSGQSESSVLPPNPYPGSQLVNALDGSQYNKGYYFGRPADHTSLTPTALPLSLTRSNVNDNIYSHAYLNVYASGSISFSKVEFVGGGFELDNVAVSDQLRTPSSELVLLQSVLGKSVEFRANGGNGSMPAQTANAASTLTSNSFTRAGHTFDGWHTTISGTGGTSYANLASYDFAADLTLYAQWTADATTSTSTSTTVAPTITATPAPAPVPAPAPATTTSAEPTTTTSSTTTIAEPVPSISAPRQILTGTSITVVARGFVPGESVVMSVGKNGKTRIVTADINGEVRLNVKLTAVGDGERVTASAVAGSRKASQVIEIKEEPATLPKTGFSPMPMLLLAILLLIGGMLTLTLRRYPKSL